VCAALQLLSLASAPFLKFNPQQHPEKSPRTWEERKAKEVSIDRSMMMVVAATVYEHEQQT